MDSPGRGNGLGGAVFAGNVVEAMYKGVWSITDQGSSFRLAEEEDRRVVERKALGRNAKMRETKWCRKFDMVLCVTNVDLCVIFQTSRCVGFRSRQTHSCIKDLRMARTHGTRGDSP